MGSWVNRFGTHTMTLTRRTPGEYVNGRYDRGVSDTSSVIGSVQPLKPNEILMVEEGRRSRAAFKVYTDTELRTANEKEGLDADILTVEGFNFEVHQVERWRLPGSTIEHFKATLLKIDGEGGYIE